MKATVNHKISEVAVTENGSVNVGDSASMSKTVSESDVINFAEITGDRNPVHLDDEYAKATVFGERIAHGMISAGIVGAVLAMKMPGPGTVYLGQELKFLAPVKIGDTITATAQIIEIGQKKRAKIKTTCVNQHGKMILEGVATVSLPRR